MEFVGRNVDGLLRASDFLGSKRALVFLLSDFHFPLAHTETIINALAYHDVVPVVIWDRSEYEDLPNFGLVRVADAETGANRLLFMRHSLRRRIAEKFSARREKITQLFARAGRSPLFLLDGFQADEVSHFFLG